MIKIVLSLCSFMVLVYANSYRDDELNIVIDELNGKIWQDESYDLVFIDKDNYLDSSPNDKLQDWKGSIDYCENLNFANYSDWRLPTIVELESISSVENSLKVDNSFKNIKSARYWSLDSDNNWSAMAFSFQDLLEHRGYRSTSSYVRCTRDICLVDGLNLNKNSIVESNSILVESIENGNSTKLEILVEPINGEIILNEDSYEYKPFKDYTGLDSLTIKAYSSGCEEIIKVNIAVVSLEYKNLIDELSKTSFETIIDWKNRVSQWSLIVQKDIAMVDYSADTQELLTSFDISDFNISKDSMSIRTSIEDAMNIYKKDSTISANFTLKALVDSDNNIILDIDSIIISGISQSSIINRLDTTSFYNLINELTKGEYEDSISHKDRLMSWNDKNLLYQFNLNKIIAYDSEAGVLYANIDTSILGARPIGVAIYIKPQGDGSNIERFIESMKANLNFKLYLDSYSNQLKPIVLRHSIDIVPKDFDRVEFVNIGVDNTTIDNIRDELSKGWYETTENWKNRVDAYSFKAILPLTMINEESGYGYDSDNKIMKAILDLSSLGFGTKSLEISLDSAAKVVEFYNKGSAIVDIKAQVDGSNKLIISNDCISLRIGEILVNFSMDGVDSFFGKVCTVSDSTTIDTTTELDQYTITYCQNSPEECGITTYIQSSDNLTNIVETSATIDKDYIDSLDSGWYNLGSTAAITNLSIFDRARIVWLYNASTSSWSAYSNDELREKLINKSSSVKSLFAIPENSGFWVYK